MKHTAPFISLVFSLTIESLRYSGGINKSQTKGGCLNLTVGLLVIQLVHYWHLAGGDEGTKGTHEEQGHYWHLAGGDEGTKGTQEEQGHYWHLAGGDEGTKGA